MLFWDTGELRDGLRDSGRLDNSMDPLEENVVDMQIRELNEGTS